MVTIHEVARRAGVGVGTVSRVVNGSPSVRDETRTRVLAAVEELGYRTNRTARGLARGRMSTIAALVPFIAHPSAFGRIRGVVEGCREIGLPVSIFDVEVPEHQHEHIRALTGDLRPEGLVVFSLWLSPTELAWLAEAGIRPVLVGTQAEGLSSVTIDDEAGGRLAAEHLLSLGHRRIGFVGDLENDEFGFTSSTLRLAGLQATLRDAGVTPDERLVRRGPHGAEQAEQMAHELLALPEPPTAVFAASDTQAFGVLRAARARGLRVPDDLSVLGFDDLDSAQDAQLTTVHQPIFASGVLAAELVASQLSSPEVEARRIVQDVHLVVRGTTGRAAQPRTPRRGR